MRVRTLRKVDSEEVVALEESWTVREDEDFGIPVCPPWTMNEADLQALVRSRPSETEGCTYLYVVEDSHGKIVGAFSCESFLDRLEVGWCAFVADENIAHWAMADMLNWLQTRALQPTDNFSDGGGTMMKTPKGPKGKKKSVDAAWSARVIVRDDGPMGNKHFEMMAAKLREFNFTGTLLRDYFSFDGDKIERVPSEQKESDKRKTKPQEFVRTHLDGWQFDWEPDPNRSTGMGPLML